MSKDRETNMTKVAGNIFVLGSNKEEDEKFATILRDKLVQKLVDDKGE